MTRLWLSQYLLFDLIKTILIISETRIGHKADLGHSQIICFCVFPSALPNWLQKAGTFDAAGQRTGILTKLPTGRLIAFSEEIHIYSEPVKPRDSNRAESCLWPFPLCLVIVVRSVLLILLIPLVLP